MKLLARMASGPNGMTRIARAVLDTNVLLAALRHKAGRGESI